MTQAWTGVGSRKTPMDILLIAAAFSSVAAQQGWVYRSGRALGFDQAGEAGCDNYDGQKQIFLPCDNFPRQWNPGKWRPKEKTGIGYPSVVYQPTSAATEMARNLMGPDHWRNCGWFARQAHSRNCHQVLGFELNDPSRFLICWCPIDINGDPQGGTATAVRLAWKHEIPVYNLHPLAVTNPRYTQNGLVDGLELLMMGKYQEFLLAQAA